jgi:peptidoglycan/LPS O-acetylase OafA/YrhL
MEARLHDAYPLSPDSSKSPSVRTTAHMKYRPDIDGIRALAVLSVVVFHAFPTALSGGFIGVDVFFVISGFLITSIVAGDVDKSAFSYATFYARRIKRIFPALLVVFAVALSLGWAVQVNDEFSSLGRHVIGSAAFFENFMLLKEPGYFDSRSELNPLLHLWSLGVEEQFYIVWPIIIGLVWRLRRSLAFVIITAIALVSLGISESWVFVHPMAAFYSPVSRFWELLAGGFVALFLVGDRSVTTSAAARNIGAAIGLAVIGFGLVIIDQQTRFPGLWAALPVLGTCLLIWAGGTSWINRTILTHPAAVWLGLISYPLYLWHWVLLAYGRLVFPRGLTTPGVLAIVGLSVLLAWATYRWVERPFKRGQMRRVAVPILCLGMVAIAGVGYAADQALEPRLAHTALNGSDFERSRDSDGSCAKLLGLPTTAEEVCQTKSSRPDVLIAGDSHAMALNSATLVGQSTMNTLLIAGHSCRVLTSVVQTPEGRQAWGNNCTAITQDIVAAARLGSIKTIVIATNGPTWSDDSARTSIGPAAPLHTYVFRDAAGHVLTKEQADLEGYRSLISTLLATGKTLVFVIDVPGLKTDPHACFTRLPFAKLASCDVPISEVARKQRGYRAFVDILAAEFPTMTIFDATKAICTDASCPASDANGYFYFDTHHLSAHGSERVLAALVTRMQAQSHTAR